MSAAEETAAEIIQVYKSGKRGFILHMKQRQEWEPVVKILQENYFREKAFIEVCGGERLINGGMGFAPVFYQRLNMLRKISDSELDRARPGSCLALGLRKWASDSGIGAIIAADYHLLDSESKSQSMLALVQMLKIGGEGPLILLTASRLEMIPPDLLTHMYVIHAKKPQPAEIKARTEQILEKKGLRACESFQREIVSYLQGFHDYEIEYLFKRAELLYGPDAFDENKRKILELIGSEKVRLLEEGQLLEWQMIRHVDLANMEVLKRHLRESGIIMSRLEDAVRNGVDVPKGILIVGIPGTGKSLFAQYAAALLKMPLIRLDMGKMMGGHVGDSERNLRNAQRQAGEMAPCILWIDEIEKGFSGSAGKGQEEGAYLRRMTGSFLTWLQEKKDSCYIIATANEIEGLPPEFFRKGRFDECFCTAMPTEGELREILRVHLSKLGRAHVECVMEEAVTNILRLAAAQMRFLTGADAGMLVSNTFRRLYLEYYAAQQSKSRAMPACGDAESLDAKKQEHDRKRLSGVMEDEFKRMKVFSETNGADIVKHDIVSRSGQFVNASFESAQEEQTRYNERLKAFIKNHDMHIKYI